MTNGNPPPKHIRLLRSLGPAIITASVVLGPGSILSASKIGYQFQYQMTWVLLLAALLMIGMTSLSARLGVTLEGTLCDELASRAGRGVAALAGVSLFLIAACFQFGNNLGVLAAVEPFYEIESQGGQKSLWPIAVIVGLNCLALVALFGFKSLYVPIERLMKLLVGLMIIAFAVNLLLAQPDPLGVLAGLVPRVPEGAAESMLPRWQPALIENGQVLEPPHIVDNLVPVTAMFATTFSVGGAFYQAYLVRQKGWTRAQLHQGLVDSGMGISLLALITLMIMATAAAVLHGQASVGPLNSVADVARQLEPAFGPAATGLFCMGIFAGAFSSFLVNAMIGGCVLSDGLGLGGHIDQLWPRLLTALALLTGMFVAVWTYWSGQRPVDLIIFAQAITVLGLPLLATALLYLAMGRSMVGKRAIPVWMKLVAVLGLIIAILLALRTAVRLYLELSH